MVLHYKFKWEWFAGEGSKEYVMNQNNMRDKRINHRMDLLGKCILITHFGMIGAQTVDISIMGLGVKTDRTFPLKLKNGCDLGVFIPNMELPQTKLMWTNRAFNNTTQLGLKFLFYHKRLTAFS